MERDCSTPTAAVQTCEPCEANCCGAVQDQQTQCSARLLCVLVQTDVAQQGFVRSPWRNSLQTAASATLGAVVRQPVNVPVTSHCQATNVSPRLLLNFACHLTEAALSANGRALQVASITADISHDCMHCAVLQGTAVLQVACMHMHMCSPAP